MPANLQIGTTVYVPRARVGLDASAPTAFTRATVTVRRDRSVRLDLGRDGESDWVPTSSVHLNIGVLIVEFGDYSTELALLDPLTTSVHQYLRLLVGDDYVRYVKVRSLDELRLVWAREQVAYSQVVMVGHGSPTSVSFAVNGQVSPAALTNEMNVAGQSAKLFVSLCCETGRRGFAKSFSGWEGCSTLIAPYHTVHGATASHFCQSFFAFHLLVGKSAGVAFKNARNIVPDGTRFRLWKTGTLCRMQN